MAQPYYDHAGITIYHGDCLEVMAELQRQSVDLILTDPPFFMPAKHYQSRATHQRAWSDTSILSQFWKSVLEQSIPLLRPTGHFLSFCNGDSWAVFYPHFYRHFHAIKCIVWDKGHFGMGRVWRNQHELILAARWKTSVFADSSNSRGDVLNLRATSPANREHPVEKPPLMLADLIKTTIGNSGLVLDCFAGSGTTLEAASRMGLSAIGIEGEERYCEIAVKRLSQGVLK